MHLTNKLNHTQILLYKISKNFNNLSNVKTTLTGLAESLASSVGNWDFCLIVSFSFASLSSASLFSSVRNYHFCFVPTFLNLFLLLLFNELIVSFVLKDIR